MLTIKDLTASKELDRNAMAAVSGGNATLISEMTKLFNAFSTQDANALATSGDKYVGQNMLSANDIGLNVGGVANINDNDTQNVHIYDYVDAYAYNDAYQHVG